MDKKKLLTISLILVFVLLALGGVYLLVFQRTKGIEGSNDRARSSDDDFWDRLAECITLVDLDSLPRDDLNYSAFTSYYVSTGGDDSNLGTLDSPFKTISHALEAVSDESVIYVREGIYKTNMLAITKSNFVLKNYENENVVLSPLARNDSWDMNEDLAILLEGDLKNVVVDGLTINGFEEGIIYGDPETQENIILKNLKIYGGAVGIGNTYPDHTKYLVKNLFVKNVTMTNMIGIGLHCGDEQRSCAQNVLVQDVIILGAEDNENDTGYDSLAMVNSDNILVIDSTFTNAPGDGLDFKATGVAVVNTVVESPNRNGIKFWHEGEIINSIVYRTGADASIVFGSDSEGSKFRIINSVVAQHLFGMPESDRYAYAITVGYDEQLAYEVELTNNIFYDMPGPIYINPQSSAEIKNNIFYEFVNDDRYVVIGNNTYSDFDSSNLFVDPKFTDPENGDWTLQSSSPAIDVGVSTEGIPDFDIDWSDRSVGGGVDIGPYEY